MALRAKGFGIYPKPPKLSLLDCVGFFELPGPARWFWIRLQNPRASIWMLPLWVFSSMRLLQLPKKTTQRFDDKGRPWPRIA